MNNTPETNAAGKFWPCEQLELVDADFARKLERERDEARERERVVEASAQNAKLQKQIEGLNNFANERFEEIQKVRRERDEAIRKLNDLEITSIHSCHNECQRPMCVLRRERDDALEQLSRICNLSTT